MYWVRHVVYDIKTLRVSSNNGGIEDEVRNRIICVWLNQNKLKKKLGILSDKRLKDRFFKTVVKTVMFCVLLFTILDSRHQNFMELRMVRWIFGVTMEDRIRINRKKKCEVSEKEQV